MTSNPKPKKGKARPTWDLVIEDMKARDQAGEKKYGVRHQSDNGRNHLQDAYEECLDKAVYLKAAIIDREEMLKKISNLEEEVESLENLVSDRSDDF